ncbi:MAG: carbon-nitrogen hydrolase family protein, partial [Planctomycetota bacterium]
NLAMMHRRLVEATTAGAVLTVFPECTITGYCFESLEQARPVMQAEDGPFTERVVEFCAELNTHTVFGYLESAGEAVFNSLAMAGPQGVVARYRKVHLPHLGIDRFTTPGDRAFEVFDTALCRIGLNICYDCAFPEAARSLALLGGDLIVLSTNWPPTSSTTADVIPNARALENHVYFMAVDRIGTENGFEFIGKSKICHPNGATLAFADHNREEIIYADIDPSVSRKKHLVNVPGVHEAHRVEDRVPTKYGALTKP